MNIKMVLKEETTKSINILNQNQEIPEKIEEVVVKAMSKVDWIEEEFLKYCKSLGIKKRIKKIK